jgi:[ribosomal protein S18]-alanine N-acetyltransferase
MFPQTLWIRDVQPDDLDTIHAIDEICFPADIAFSRREFDCYIKHPQSIAYVAEGKEGIAGFVLARIENRSAAHVLTLDIMPQMRRCGVGMQLMKTLHDRLEQLGVKTSTLEVSVQNIAAQCLYKKLGYEICGLLPGYYQDREDAYPMKRRFKGIEVDSWKRPGHAAKK